MNTTLICATLLVVSPILVLAQQTPVGTPMPAAGGIEQSIGDAMGKSLALMMSHAVVVTPAQATLNPKATTAAFEVANPGDDTLDVALSVSALSPDMATQAGSDSAASLMVDTTAATHPTSVPSLVSWATITPRTMQLPPHAKGTVTVRLEVPNGATPDDYTGWVLASTTARVTQKKGHESPSVSFGDADKPIYTGAQLLYHL